MSSPKRWGIPKVIKVNGFDINIEIDFTMDKNDEHHGFFEWENSRIVLNGARLNGVQVHGNYLLADLVLHETMHAIWWAIGIAENDNEERIVNNMTMGLIQVLRDNPKLVAFLLKAIGYLPKPTK